MSCPDLAVVGMDNTNADVLISRVDQIGIVCRAIYKRIEETWYVVDGMHTDVFAQHRPVFGYSNTHVGGVSQLIVVGHRL